MADRYMRDLFQGNEMEKIARALADEKIERKFVCEGPHGAVAIGKDSYDPSKPQFRKCCEKHLY
ncbi:hypothetical protein T10_2165 [Trichinella papuae]|uniref:Uncharacterized protein n=1 Tax=Trichinella papuae TaxID=268474 RepID=A0A0V1M5W6_9BILA|nr:hypothetical protein T10_2165 [Trichinella papuae]